jgi:hypothetical protein
MRLRFPESQINEFAELYVKEMSEKDRISTDAIILDVFPSYEQKGYLTRNEFLTVCEWKSPRSRPRCESNEESFIEEVSRLVLTAKSERIKIQAWTLLDGVQWPTASVFLHFAFPNQYPILDFRALWSLTMDVPSSYTYPFWEKYINYCRILARQAGVTMRILDQALWKYSEIHQRKSGRGQGIFRANGSAVDAELP